MLGNAAAAAIVQKFGTNYTVGSTAETLCTNVHFASYITESKKRNIFL